MKNKETWNNRIKRKFGLPNNAKIVYYRHPKEFMHMTIEKINPTHKIDIWGVPKKKYRSGGTVNNSRVGRIIIPSLILTSLFSGFTIEMLTNFLFIFEGVAIAYMVYGFNYYGVKKCLSKTLELLYAYWYRRWIRFRKDGSISPILE